MFAVSEREYSLAFETSGDLGGVALGRGDRILATRLLSGPRRHAVEFLATIAALCGDHSVEPNAVRNIYVSIGPGSFTGLRIGMTVARLLAFAHGARIAAVPTLEAIAQNAAAIEQPPKRLVVMLDAKRSHVYAATFELHDGVYRALCDPAEVEPLSCRESNDRATAYMGKGATLYREALRAAGGVILPETLSAPNVDTVYRIGLQRACRGLFVEPRKLIPLYVRLPEAEEKWRKRHESSGRVLEDATGVDS